MTLMTQQTFMPSINERPIASLTDALSIRDEVIWSNMNGVSIEQAVNQWLKTLANDKTRKNYTCAFKKLYELGILNPLVSLQQFAVVSHRTIIQAIKRIEGLSECSKQARAAAYISFTRYLSDVLEGNFKRAIPCRDGTIQTTKTFERVHEEVETQAMAPNEWQAFLVELQKINPRDCLIAKLALQGAKRLNEVLSLTKDKINFETGEITFIQLKTKGKPRKTIITYPVSILNELRNYIGDRKGLVFITRSGKGVLPTQVQNTFAQAGVAANIRFKVHPHVLRASAITEYKRLGYSDTDISKISGHSLEMLNAYDKSSKKDNASKKVSLVS